MRPFQDGNFKAGNELARDAKDIKEFIPERLFVGALAGGVLVVARELDGIVADFVPREWHGAKFAREMRRRQFRVRRRYEIAERMAAKRFFPDSCATGVLDFELEVSTSSSGSSFKNGEGWHGNVWPYFLRPPQWLMASVCIARVTAT